MSTKDKIRICFVLFGAYPLFNPRCDATFGGAEVDLYNVAVNIAKNSKYEITFLVGDYGQDMIEYYNEVKVIKHHYEKIGNDNDNKVCMKTFKYLDLIRKLLFTEADIYFTECASELLGWMVLINGRIKRKKVVFRLASDTDTDLGSHKKGSKRFYYMYRYGLLYADLVISQTETQSTALNRLNIESPVIKNGFVLSQSKDIKIEKKKYILWVGRCVPEKRPELVVELARRMPEEKFILIMPTYESQQYACFTNSILGSISQLDNVQYIKYVPFSQIQSYFEEAKVFLNTSDNEGFPNTFIQACMAKTSILSFRVNPDGFITANKLGYVCDNSLESATAFIRDLDYNELLNYGKNAFEYVVRNHNIDEIIKRYDDLFGQM